MKSFRLSIISTIVRFASVFLIFEFILFDSNAQTAPHAGDLLRQMTIEEKIAQLSQLPGFPVPEYTQQVGTPIDEIIRKY